jgi:hypothetical protein
MPAGGERKIVGNAQLAALRMRYRKCDGTHPSVQSVYDNLGAP